MTKYRIHEYLMVSAVIYLVLVFLPSLYFKITSSPYIFQILNPLNEWIAPYVSDYWAELIRSYGHYVLANLEIATVLLVLFPVTRLIGALLGLLAVSMALFAYLITPLSVSITIGRSAQQLDGILLGLAWGVVAACIVIIWSAFSRKRAVYATAGSLVQLNRDRVEKSDSGGHVIEDLVSLDREVPYDTEVTLEVKEAFHQILFDRKHRVRDEIAGDHKRVVERAESLIASLPSQRKYFPRRPMIIPKLIRAVNSETSTKKDLVEVISQDPVLAGELLKIANSPFYRISEDPVESIGRAVVLLGMNGLKALTSTLVMQPVVKVEVGYFPEYSSRIWIQAASAAEAAQAYARKTRSCDSFTAHLLGLISSIGHIVIFQMVMDVYKEFSGIRPSESVIKLVRSRYADKVSAAVAEHWGMSEDFLATLHAYEQKKSLNEMDALTRALYYGRLCATLHILHNAGLYTEERVRFVTNLQGLHANVFDAIWLVLESDGQRINEVWGESTTTGQQETPLETGM